MVKKIFLRSYKGIKNDFLARTLNPRVGAEEILAVLVRLLRSLPLSSRRSWDDPCCPVRLPRSSNVQPPQNRCPCPLSVLVRRDPSRDVTGKRKEVRIKYAPNFIPKTCFWKKKKIPP